MNEITVIVVRFGEPFDLTSSLVFHTILFSIVKISSTAASFVGRVTMISTGWFGFGHLWVGSANLMSPFSSSATISSPAMDFTVEHHFREYASTSPRDIASNILRKSFQGTRKIYCNISLIQCSIIYVRQEFKGFAKAINEMTSSIALLTYPIDDFGKSTRSALKQRENCITELGPPESLDFSS